MSIFFSEVDYTVVSFSTDFLPTTFKIFIYFLVQITLFDWNDYAVCAFNNIIQNYACVSLKLKVKCFYEKRERTKIYTFLKIMLASKIPKSACDSLPHCSYS